jgi:hypothetical protein
VKGVWTHVVVSAVLAIVTVTVSWFIYPFSARQILERHYSRAEWVPVGPTAGQPDGLTTCPFCAEFIRSEAIVCKHCGKDIEASIAPDRNILATSTIQNDQPRSRIGKLGWVFGALVVASVVGAIVQESKSPQQRAEETRKAEQSARLSYSPDLVQMAVNQLLRDPESAKFGAMSVYADRKLNGKQVTVVCGSVNAKNGFGGHSGSKNFVYVKETLAATLDSDQDNAHFVRPWNALCAAKHN